MSAPRPGYGQLDGKAVTGIQPHPASRMLAPASVPSHGRCRIGCYAGYASCSVIAAASWTTAPG
jgi:hypothetical protein